MATAPKRFCAAPGCDQLVTTGRCTNCHTRPYQPWRDYTNPEYRQNRKRLLELTPHCETCGQPASIADHRTPLRTLWLSGAWPTRHQLHNLRPLCKPCHDQHTANTAHPYRSQP